MYNLTRQDVADKLNISTRSVDRYIRSWKLRSKKDWKVVYVNSDDVESIVNSWDYQQEVIVEKKYESSQPANVEPEVKTVAKNDENLWSLWTIYKDLKEEIQKKDQLIQTLAIRVWKAEEIAKNSVSLIDFKKSQYLLEESKQNIDKELSKLEKDKEKLSKDLKYEKNTNIIFITFLVVLLIVAVITFIVKI